MLLHQNLKIFSASKDCSISINSKRIYHLALALGGVFATKPCDKFQNNNRLVLAGDAASIEEKKMDTDISKEVYRNSSKKLDKNVHQLKHKAPWGE